ncbi:MAG: hypothetical protein V1742_11425 [Pseudomonadota bacterium]
MPDSLEYIKALAAKARQAEPPEVDTASRVILRLRLREYPLEAPLAGIAAASFAAAAVVLALSLPLLFTLTDPLGGLFWLAAEILP